MEDNILSFHKLSDFDLWRPRCTGYVPIAVDYDLLGCHTALLGEQFLAFEMMVVVPSPSGSSSLRGPPDSEDEGARPLKHHPVTLCHIQEKLNPWQHCYETHKSHISHCWFSQLILQKCLNTSENSAQGLAVTGAKANRKLTAELHACP
jgi:hypothetical protein